MIRRIKASDKKRVLEISSQIWEGEDYLFQVFDEWVNDNGVFAGLWENNILVGFGKLTWLTPTDVWLEGLRKDEKSGAVKVGEKLSKYYLNYLKEKELNSIRFSTYFGNTASIKLNEKLGFIKILELSLKTIKIESSIKKISENLTKDISFSIFKKFVENSKYLQEIVQKVKYSDHHRNYNNFYLVICFIFVFGNSNKWKSFSFSQLVNT